jgi:hypothetical protein
MLAEPAVRASQVLPQQRMRHGQADRAAHHIAAIDQHCAATGATMQDVYARRFAARKIDNLRHTVPQTEADHYGSRRRDVPALQGRPAWLHAFEQRFVTCQRFARVLGW